MATTKDRGADTSGAAKSSQQDEVCVETFLNRGIPVTLSTGQIVYVRDIPFDAWLDGLANVLPILVELADKGTDDLSFMFNLAGNPSVRKAVYLLMHRAITQLSEQEIADLPTKDAVQVIKALHKAVDFKEISELFSQLALRPTTS